MSRVRLYATLLTALVIGVPLAAGAPLDAPKPPKIDSYPTDPSASNNASFTFSDGSKVTFRCQLDSGGFSDCGSDVKSGSIDYSALGDGSHTFNVKAVNEDGESGLTSYSWTIDTQPPVLTISQKPENPTGASNAHFEFTATDLTSVTFECQLDGGSVEACSPPDKNYPNLTSATHVFTLKGTDVFGKASTTSYSWLVDAVRPVVTITSAPRNPTNQTAASFSFSSNKSGSTFRCRLDGGDFSTCTSPKAYVSLAEGTHSFFVRASNVLTGPTTTFSWTIDLTPPPAPSIGSGPTNPTEATTASFVFSDGEAGVTFSCQLDGGAIQACTSPASYSGLGAGGHTFAVRATDPAGNTAAAAGYGWTVRDATAPGDVRRLNRKVGYGILRLTWSRPQDADFDYVRVLVAKGSKAAKGQPRTSVYKGTGTRYMNKRFQNGTAYRYAVISYDRAGNASKGVPVVITPNALLTSPRSAARLRTPPLLDWASVPNARFYNAQLYFGSRKILSAWPTHSKLKVNRSWSYQDRIYRLKKGTYRWYVWPAFGGRSKPRYGHVLGQASFVFTG